MLKIAEKFVLIRLTLILAPNNFVKAVANKGYNRRPFSSCGKVADTMNVIAMNVVNIVNSKCVKQAA